MEIYGVICNNLPAQVVGLHTFLETADGKGSAIAYIPCVNYMVNLVFTHTIKSGIFPEVLATLPEIIRIFHSAPALDIIGVRYPRLIRTKWIYLVDVLVFLIDHFTEVQTTFGLAARSLRRAAYCRVYLLLLPLSLFSQVMGVRSRMLCQVIPATQEVLPQWSCIYDFFGDTAEVIDCLNVVTAHFLACLSRDAFDVILTAFAFSSVGRSEICMAEQGFRMQSKIIAPGELAFVNERRQELQRVLTLQERLHIDGPDLQHPVLSIDGILGCVQGPIRHQSACLGYEPEKVSGLFENWIFQEVQLSPSLNPDQYWRRFRGRPDKLAPLVHVGIHFSTLGCSEADVERLLSAQKHIQGVHGTNCRTDTLHARLVLYKPR
jgi:hypothetical protein